MCSHKNDFWRQDNFGFKTIVMKKALLPQDIFSSIHFFITEKKNLEP